VTAARGGVPARLVGYAGLVALVFGVAWVAGAWFGPEQPVSAATGTATGAAGHDDGGAEPMAEGDHEASEDDEAHAADVPPGLQVSQDGYTLRPAAAVHPAGDRVPFAFEVTGPDGRPLTSYEPTHEKELHLIVVRRDLSGFQHVHPVRDATGRWSVPLDLRAAGTYRVFADFAPGGQAGEPGAATSLTLGTDIAVGGAYTPAPLPPPAARAAVDGYEVALTGTPEPGREVELAFTVTRDGAPVTGLQPYLGAFGHLVSLRTGDLAYLHTHPAEEAHAGDSGGPEVRFATTFPTAGSYRLFLDFQVGGAVRTAAFTVTVPDAQRTS
jgi:hypothetical protein